MPTSLNHPHFETYRQRDRRRHGEALWAFYQGEMKRMEAKRKELEGKRILEDVNSIQVQG